MYVEINFDDSRSFSSFMRAMKLSVFVDEDESGIHVAWQAVPDGAGGTTICRFQAPAAEMKETLEDIGNPVFKASYTVID